MCAPLGGVLTGGASPKAAMFGVLGSQLLKGGKKKAQTFGDGTTDPRTGAIS